MKTPTALAVMRTRDTWRVHPDQDDSHVCSKCGEPVSIYPSGMKALKANPGLPIICVGCIVNEPAGKLQPARPWSEIQRELRESKLRQ